MKADSPRHHGLSFLPKIFADPGPTAASRSIAGRHYLLLLAVLVPPPLIAYYLKSIAFPGYALHNHLAHALLEGFCALISLIVFYILHHEYRRSSNRPLKLMAYGFLTLGILDFFHALSRPGSDLFVWYRSWAAFGGALFLFLSQVADARLLRPLDHLQGRVGVAIVGLAVVVFALGGAALEPWLPAMKDDGVFAAAAVTLNVLAGICYLLAGVYLLEAFRRRHEPVLFVFLLGMLLLAESQALFPFSQLWGVSWWAWHWIRAVVFIGILVGLAYEYVQSAAELEASQAQLLESEKLLSRGEMAASVAHEIRNPLGIVRNSLDLLRDKRLTAGETEEVLGILEREVNRINHIVSDTLSFAHGATPERVPVALRPLVEQTMGQVMQLKSDVQLATTFDPDLPPVLGEAHQLQQVIWNLADNALAAINGKGEIRIRAFRDGAAVVLQIQDSGCGISPELRDLIFKPFFSTKIGGTGLGLPIVQRIVHGHGGRIRIDSTQGRGTLVAVWLPAAAQGGRHEA